MTFETVTISAGRDYNLGLHGRYEFVIFSPAEDVLERATGFKSKAQAQRAAVKAAQKFLGE